METDSFKKPLNHLFETPWFHLLFKKVRELQHLSQLVHRALASFPHKNELGQCQVMQYQAGCLKIVTDNSTWAARIRYISSELIQLLQAWPEFKNLRSIHCQVQPPNVPLVTRSSLPGPGLKPQTAKLLAELAVSISDPDLKAALLRFAHLSGSGNRRDE